MTPSAGPCSLSRSDIVPLFLVNPAPSTEHLVERIKQGRLIRPLGYTPVMPRQPGEGGIGSPADRHRGDPRAALVDPGDTGKPSKNRRGPWREKQREGDRTRAQAVDCPRAQRASRPSLVEDASLDGKPLRAQQAEKIARNDISGDVKQWPVFAAQSCCRQAGEISDVASGALDRTETFGASARRRCVADREEGHPTQSAGPRQSANPVCAGTQNSLNPVEIERLRPLVMDLHQRFNQRLDASGCQGRDQALRIFARPCDQCAQTGLFHPIPAHPR